MDSGPKQEVRSCIGCPGSCVGSLDLGWLAQRRSPDGPTLSRKAEPQRFCLTKSDVQRTLGADSFAEIFIPPAAYRDFGAVFK